ncbi:MAG TPA: DUF4349 domain-containing protein [Pyrinomonadaceae bacterium]|nr:DUF4349 domain-containing protein [Pyrinomonadaceae bacterium]
MKKAKFTVFLLFVSLTACSAASEQATNTPSSIEQSDSVTQSREKVANNPSAPPQQVSLEQSANNQTPPTVTERKIIRNADLQLESNTPEETQQKIAAIVESKGGFVIQSTQNSSNSQVTTRDTVSMSVRVPAEKFNETLNEIRPTASRVIVETIEGKDVTEEFVDVQARLRAKKALEEQFLEIMKRSNSVQDALNVQRELGNVRTEIEQIEGRLRFLENQTSLSTIKIRIQTPQAFSTSSSGFFYQLKEAVSTGFNFALNFLLVLVTLFIGLLPFLLFIVLPIYLLVRYFLKRNRKQKLAEDIAREEIRET